jgi:heat shock protein HtpX
MWEQIRANKRRSLFLVLLMAAIFIGFGYALGEAYAPHGGLVGVALAMVVWVVLSLVSFYAGDNIMLAMSHAREITHDDHPQLYNVVEEMKIASGMPKMPRIFIIDEPAPNAFATGRKPEISAIAVTAGLLKKLKRDELQGVIGHEMSHIKNRDILYVTLAGVFVGSIVIIADIFLRSLYFGGGGRRYRSSDRGGGQAQVIFLILAIGFAILGPIAARLLYFALSRRREYLADAGGALLTRYPEGLASALEKIAADSTPLAVASRATAPLYIINPLKKAGMVAANLTSTHPPIDKRIRILRGMAGASLIDYEREYKRVTGSSGGVIPPSGLKTARPIDVRKPVPEPAGIEEKKKKVQDVNDLLQKVSNYAFLACPCGLRMKIPPEVKEDKVKCPRCGRVNAVPVAQLAAVGAIAAAAGAREAPAAQSGERLRFVRKPNTWSSFKCACNRTISLSPAYQGSTVTCPNCKRTIEIATE